MLPFFESSNRNGVHMDKYVDAWSKHIFSGRSPASLSQPARRDESIRIGERVKKLWKTFNSQREKLDKYYLDNFDNFLAYNAGFLLPNVQRVFSICRSPELIGKLQTIAARNKKLHILDFGAGPLSASAGIVAAIAHCPPEVIEISAVERTKRAYDLGVQLLRAAIPTSERLVTHLLSSPTKASTLADIIIAANVFNEIPLNHRRRSLDGLLEKLADGGLLIIVEPGQDIHSRALSSLRDSLIENPSCKFSIVAPCLHKAKCPLSSESNRSDWCWFQTSWKPPLVLAELDRYTGLRHVELNYSYLVLEKSVPTAKTTSFARVVSDPIQVGGPTGKGSFLRWAQSNIIVDTNELLKKSQPGEVFTKTLLCTTAGKLEASIETTEKHLRGDVVKECDAPCRCQERVELSAKATSPSTGGRNLRGTESRSPRSQKARPTQKTPQTRGRAKTQKPRR